MATTRKRGPPRMPRRGVRRLDPTIKRGEYRFWRATAIEGEAGSERAVGERAKKRGAREDDGALAEVAIAVVEIVIAASEGIDATHIETTTSWAAA